MSLKEKLLDLFFPPRCAFCRRTGVHGVCADCERTLPYAKVQLCEGAGFGRCVSPLLYEDAVREMKKSSINYKISRKIFEV